MILKQKKRILITLAYYYPNLTGMSLNIMNMAECLAKDGYDVTVITSRHEKDLPPREKINGVSVIRLTPLFRISRGVILPAFPFVAARHILENDIIQINSPMIENAFVAIFSKLLRKKLVIIHHGDLVLPEGLLNRFIEFTVLNLYKIAALLADKIISYSDDYAKHSRYFSLFPKKIEVIPPPIRITEPDPEGVERLIKKHDLEGKKLLGYAGRFVKEKRPELLIKTIPYIIKKFPDMKILFVGQKAPAYENYYKKHKTLLEQYRDHIVFLGVLPYPQGMADFYKACDVLVLPSDTECFAIVQVEAMLTGTPVVVTDTPGGRYAVSTTGMGEIANMGDEADIAEKIIRVLEHKSKYIDHIDKVKEIFDLNKTMSLYEESFASL